jgi:hypothetical protein
MPKHDIFYRNSRRCNYNSFTYEKIWLCLSPNWCNYFPCGFGKGAKRIQWTHIDEKGSNIMKYTVLYSLVRQDFIEKFDVKALK